MTRRRPWLEALVLATALVAGLAHGAATAWRVGPARSPSAVDVAAPPPPLAPAQRPAIEGRFWRPAGSDAVRPQAQLEARRWTPWPSLAAPRSFVAPIGEAG